jgi:hypothetical protein
MGTESSAHEDHQNRIGRRFVFYGFFCTKREAPVTADMIDRVLADLSVRARK